MSHREQKVPFDDATASDKYSLDGFMSEKISIEPDLGDQRKSVYKPLPAPPTTPKRVLKKYRVTALLPLVLFKASIVLIIAVVLARKGNRTLGGQYLIVVRRWSNPQKQVS